MVRSRGFCPWPVVKPSFQVFSLSSQATNSVASVMLPCSWWGAAVVMGFLLHGDRLRVMEKKLTNSGPFRELVDKHSIYLLALIACGGEQATPAGVMPIRICSAVACNGSGVTPMKLATSQKVPLTQWKDNTVRITGTRVPLDVIVNQFKLGATAEQIHDSFPAVSLKDVYGAIYYYLEHTDAVDVYMREQQLAVAETRQWVESQ